MEKRLNGRLDVLDGKIDSLSGKFGHLEAHGSMPRAILDGVREMLDQRAPDRLGN